MKEMVFDLFHSISLRRLSPDDISKTALAAAGAAAGAGTEDVTLQSFSALSGKLTLKELRRLKRGLQLDAVGYAAVARRLQDLSAAADLVKLWRPLRESSLKVLERLKKLKSCLKST